MPPVNIYFEPLYKAKRFSMANDYFSFRQFNVKQGKAAFKVGTDGVLLGACADFSGAEKILDVGTGTGVLALMAAQRSGADITAIEPDLNSFIQASENISESPWPGRIMVINDSFQDFSQNHKTKFDVIITNPPFFRDSLKNPDTLKSAARHTDYLSSDDILRGASELLNESGSLQLILPYVEGNLFIAEAASFGFFCNRIIKIRPTPTGEIKRMILLFEKIRKPAREKFLTIETGRRHQYTEDYKVITKDFYLKF
jgi:tRNA1Val (adenine37-N6)-methyltransferase